MSNHPNRGPKGPYSNPSPTEIKEFRESHGMKQKDFGAQVYSSERTVQDWEGGRARMHPGLFELAKLKLEILPSLSTKT